MADEKLIQLRADLAAIYRNTTPLRLEGSTVELVDGVVELRAANGQLVASCSEELYEELCARFTIVRP